MSRQLIENYCKKHNLIKLKSYNLGGEQYYFDAKKISLLNSHYFLKIQLLLKLQQ